MNGVHETGAVFDDASLSGFHRFRRFGPDGPAYEVQSVESGVAVVRVIQSGETLSYPVKDALTDPEA